MNSNNIFLALCILLSLMMSCKNGDSNATSETIAEPVDKLDALNKAIMSGKKDPELYYDRATYFYKQKAYKNALQDIFIAMKIDSMQPKYYTLGADALLYAGQSNSSLQLLEKGEDLFPDNHPIRLKHGEILITLNQLPEAIRKIDHVLYQDNNNPQAFFLMGYIMTLIDDKEKAIKALKQAVAIDPEIMDAYILLSELYEDDDPQLALQYINNAMTVAPDMPQPYHTKAFYLQNHGQELEALDVYRQMQQRFPSYPASYLNAGILLLEMDSIQSSINNFNQYISYQPADPNIYYYRGLAYVGLDSINLAKRDFQTAVNIDSSYVKAQELLDEL